MNVYELIKRVRQAVKTLNAGKLAQIDLMRPDKAVAESFIEFCNTTDKSVPRAVIDVWEMIPAVWCAPDGVPAPSAENGYDKECATFGMYIPEAHPCIICAESSTDEFLRCRETAGRPLLEGAVPNLDGKAFVKTKKRTPQKPKAKSADGEQSKRGRPRSPRDEKGNIIPKASREVVATADDIRVALGMLQEKPKGRPPLDPELKRAREKLKNAEKSARMSRYGHRVNTMAGVLDDMLYKGMTEDEMASGLSYMFGTPGHSAHIRIQTHVKALPFTRGIPVHIKHTIEHTFYKTEIEQWDGTVPEELVANIIEDFRPPRYKRYKTTFDGSRKTARKRGPIPTIPLQDTPTNEEA